MSISGPWSSVSATSSRRSSCRSSAHITTSSVPRSTFRVSGASTSGKVDWWDPFIGGILTLPLGERWNFQLHADIGGFGVGSDLAWQIEMLFNWFLSPRTSLMMGYRAISIDYDDDGFVYDVVSQGPQLGITMRF